MLNESHYFHPVIFVMVSDIEMYMTLILTRSLMFCIRMVYASGAFIEAINMAILRINRGATFTRERVPSKYYRSGTLVFRKKRMLPYS